MALPFETAELDHVVLRCADQARALDFYTTVLGLKEERRIDAIGLIQLRAGRSMIDLVPAPGPRAEQARNVDHVCLGIEAADMSEVVRYLRQHQVEVIGEPAMRYGARGMGLSIYVRDPEGNVVELKQLQPTAERE
jgi:glyoxylase I family protein